jgi:hypothetical protein
MTVKDISGLIVRNKCLQVQIEDYGSNKLHNIVCKNATQCAQEFEDSVEDFRDYGKLEISARPNDSTTWGNAFCWQLNFKESGKKDGKEIAGPGTNGTIGAMDYIRSWTEQESRISNLHRENLELKMQLQNNDPSKWLPIMYAAGSAFGMDIKMPMQGPPAGKTKLVSGKMNLEDIQEGINKEIDSLGPKMQAAQFLELLQGLNNVPNLKTNIEKVNKLIEAIGTKPELLDMAMKFV